jgi:hypothetical protein
MAPTRRIRVLLALFATLIAAFALASPASAVAAKFHSATGSVNANGSLTVAFDERGLGNDNINYTLTADYTAVFACINGGGNHPQAANKETVHGAATAAGTFQPKNGRVQASLTTAAPSAGDFTCPSGQRLVLASVSYTGITLTDTTNGTSITVADVSRVFFAV